MPALRLVGATITTMLGLVSCSGGDGADPESSTDAAARLGTAADLLDETSGVQFTIEGEDLPDSGTVILGADGVAAPPGSFEGEIRVLTSGLSATIDVVSVDGELWAKLPMTTEFARVDPGELGLSDPGLLLDPDQGVSRLLRAAIEPTEADQVRVGADVLDQVSATLPGELVGSVLTIADPDAAVQATFGLDAETGQLRRAVLTGPFVTDSGDQTYTVLLDGYDQAVDIRAPAD